MPYIRRMGVLLVLLFGAALATAMAWKPAPPPHFAGLGSGAVPRTLVGYTASSDDPISPVVRAALASADIISRTYSVQTYTGKEAINFTLIGGTDRSALHDPRSCLIGAGMQLQDDHLEVLPGTNIEARTCRAVSADGPVETGHDLIYFYVVNGRVVTQVTQIRAAMLESALFGRRGNPIYFLRFTRPLNLSDSLSETRSHTRMQQFAAAMWGRLHSKLSCNDQTNCAQ